jgi:bacterioferritin-associated ferredoxin
MNILSTTYERALMYVCLCQGVTDGQIREAIYDGCCSYRDVRETLGVASQCGKCACLAKQVVRDTLGDIHASQTTAARPGAFIAA